LEQFRSLPLPEQRELAQAILRESQAIGVAPMRRRTVAEVAGKFRPTPNPEAEDHDRWFAEAILTSKRGNDKP